MIFFFFPSVLFTVTMIIYDRKAVKYGLVEACRWLLYKYYSGTEVTNYNVPENKGVLLLSNHPGVGDSTALVSILKRGDIMIAALDRMFTRSLPGFYDYIIPVPESDKSGMVKSINLMLKYLESGKIVILYPAGVIEPDPEHRSNEEILKKWESLAGYLCLKARMRKFSFFIIPVLVKNVFSVKSLSNPLVNLKKNLEEKEKLAALHILLTKTTKDQKVKIIFRQELESLELAEKFGNSESITIFIKSVLSGNYKFFP
jgi:hypothetical protein